MPKAASREIEHARYSGDLGRFLGLQAPNNEKKPLICRWMKA